jgi:hypothetical protein
MPFCMAALLQLMMEQVLSWPAHEWSSAGVEVAEPWSIGSAE